MPSKISNEEANALAVHLARKLDPSTTDAVPKSLLYDNRFMEKLFEYLKRLDLKRQQDGSN